MNKEVIKAINKKETIFTKICKWWNKNDYKVYRIIFFPFWIVSVIKDKITNYLNSKQTWNEKRANNILNYYIPRYCEWDKTSNSFYFFDNGYGWNLYYAKDYLKRKDYKFWKCNNLKIRQYLIETFELEGFTKNTLDSTYYGWTEIIFTLKEGA